MTLVQMAESAGVSGLAAASTAGTAVALDVGAWAGTVATLTAAAVVGYFSAQLTAAREMGDLKAEVRALAAEVRGLPKAIADSEERNRREMETYYQRRGPS